MPSAAWPAFGPGQWPLVLRHINWAHYVPVPRPLSAPKNSKSATCATLKEATSKLFAQMLRLLILLLDSLEEDPNISRNG